MSAPASGDAGASPGAVRAGPSSPAALLRARPFHVAAGSVAAGLALSPAPPVVAFAVAAAVAGGLCACRATRLAALAGALVLAGAAAGDARLAALQTAALPVGGERAVELRAHLLTRPRASPFGASAEAEVATGPLSGARLLVRVPLWNRLPARAGPGHELLLAGRLRALGDGGFGAHVRRRGVAAELLLDRARLTGRTRGGLAGLLDGMRARSEQGVAAGLPEAQAALALGMVLGQDERIDEATREDWRDSGLAHLLAVSGQNVMLLVALALPFLALARAGPQLRGALLVALIALYVPLAGAGPSLQRAAVMGAAGIAAVMLSRPSSAWYALLLAAAATLALDPRAVADPGWQLSFAAVAGILLVGRPAGAALASAGEELMRKPGPLARALCRGLADAVAITLAATVATAPLVAFHFDAVPLAGLLANVLALPAVAPAMWLGMVKAALGLAGAALPGAEAVAAHTGALAKPPLAYLDLVAERCADLPGGRMELPLRSPLAVCGAYVLIGLALTWMGRAGRLTGLAADRAERAARWWRAPRPFRVGAVLAAAAACLLAGASLLGSPRPPGELTVSFLDVGQGDATLVQHPDGTAVLFDGGPPEGGVVRLLRRAGVRRLAVVVATHASRDHHGGLAEVLARHRVGVLLDGGDGTSDPDFGALLRDAAKRNVRTVAAVAPMSLAAGAVRIRLLSPPPRPPGPAPEDPNSRAVVAVVSVGAFDLLLSADAESDSLLPLALPDVEAMKVAHHGSADPGLPELLERVRPELAAVEVGPNTYGHPAPSTLAALRRAGVTTYRTDRDGTVTLTAADGAMRVATER